MDEHEEYYFDQIIAATMVEIILHSVDSKPSALKEWDTLKDTVCTDLKNLVSDADPQDPRRLRIERFVITFCQIYNQTATNPS